jgi:hypothetical protein
MIESWMEGWSDLHTGWTKAHYIDDRSWTKLKIKMKILRVLEIGKDKDICLQIHHPLICNAISLL